MQIPHSKIELMLAWISVDSGEIDLGKAAEIEEEVSRLCPADKKELNEKIAAFNGIKAIELINSPNYGILCDEYHEFVFKKLVKRSVAELGLSEKQVWALIAKEFGLI